MERISKTIDTSHIRSTTRLYITGSQKDDTLVEEERILKRINEIKALCNKNVKSKSLTRKLSHLHNIVKDLLPPPRKPIVRIIKTKKKLRMADSLPPVQEKKPKGILSLYDKIMELSKTNAPLPELKSSKKVEFEFLPEVEKKIYKKHPFLSKRKPNVKSYKKLPAGDRGYFSNLSLSEMESILVALPHYSGNTNAGYRRKPGDNMIEVERLLR